MATVKSVTVLACSELLGTSLFQRNGRKMNKTGVRFETGWPKHKGEACPAVLSGSRGE